MTSLTAESDSAMLKNLLNNDELERSEVVANAAMNRERGIAGINSYSEELRLDLSRYLQERLDRGGEAAWLDLCCGTGKALIEAAQELLRRVPNAKLMIFGVDLVDMFCAIPPSLCCVHFHASPVRDFHSNQAFDLITCVHGLHYIGDKLGEISRFVSWLKPTGMFVANFDLSSIRSAEGESLASPVGKLLRQAGMSYDGRRKLLTCTEPVVLDSPWTYVGADDTAGANYTGQPAAESYYRVR